jgi:N-acetylglutamate synthase-like GNAT family acetyltransferase
MIIRRFEQEDAKYIADLINRNFFEVNIKDYTKEELEAIAYSDEKVKTVAGYAHMYVCCIENEIVGCGAISSFWGSMEESILLTIFVKPELHKQGIGKSIIETLEDDELFLRAKRIEIPASKTACEFYIKMGYDYKDRIKQLDDEGHYRMEKFR